MDACGGDFIVVFDIMIRQAGWHFIWISGSCSRRGCAWTQAKAIENALGRALGAVSKQSNAADFDSVRVTKCLGFHVATVTVQRRRIQELSLLEADVRDGSRDLHADVREIRSLPRGLDDHLSRSVPH
jgi:hypothetical protein